MLTKSLPPLDVRQRYTIAEAGDYLRVSRGFVYKLIGRGDLPTIREGRRTFIPGQAIADRCRIGA